MARKDSDIRADVLAEMVWDPKVTVADIGVSVEDGYVTLSGVASTFATKYAATDAAFRIYGVKDVDNDIIVDPAAFGLRTDEQIAADPPSEFPPLKMPGAPQAVLPAHLCPERRGRGRAWGRYLNPEQDRRGRSPRTCPGYLHADTALGSPRRSPTGV